MAFVRRLRSAWQRHGAAGFFRLAAKNAVLGVGEFLSGRALRRSHRAVSEFDTAHGTDTEAIREVGSLDVESPSARHAVRYQPSPYRLAEDLIGQLPIDHRRFTFIDFGAGKGRVLLLAAQWPFAAVIGIEFSRELCAIAVDNISKLTHPRTVGQIACVHSDATTYRLPHTPLVCYFYNPFGEAVMQPVEKQLAMSFDVAPRDIYVIYVDPKHRALFDARSRWEILAAADPYVIYRARLDGTQRS